MANIHDAIGLCLQVIAEDAADSEQESFDVKIVELPLQEFLTK